MIVGKTRLWSCTEYKGGEILFILHQCWFWFCSCCGVPFAKVCSVNLRQFESLSVQFIFPPHVSPSVHGTMVSTVVSQQECPGFESTGQLHPFCIVCRLSPVASAHSCYWLLCLWMWAWTVVSLSPATDWQPVQQILWPLAIVPNLMDGCKTKLFFFFPSWHFHEHYHFKTSIYYLVVTFTLCCCHVLTKQDLMCLGYFCICWKPTIQKEISM